MLLQDRPEYTLRMISSVLHIHWSFSFNYRGSAEQGLIDGGSIQRRDGITQAITQGRIDNLFWTLKCDRYYLLFAQNQNLQRFSHEPKPAWSA